MKLQITIFIKSLWYRNWSETLSYAINNQINKTKNNNYYDHKRLRLINRTKQLFENKIITTMFWFNLF